MCNNFSVQLIIISSLFSATASIYSQDSNARDLEAQEVEIINEYQSFYSSLLRGSSELNYNITKIQAHSNKFRDIISFEAKEKKHDSTLGYFSSLYKIENNTRIFSDIVKIKFSNTLWKKERINTSNSDKYFFSDIIYDGYKSYSCSFFQNDNLQTLNSPIIQIIPKTNSSYAPGYEQLDWRVNYFVPLLPLENDNQQEKLVLNIVSIDSLDNDLFAVAHLKPDGSFGSSRYIFNKNSKKIMSVILGYDQKSERPLPVRTLEYEWQSGLDFPSIITNTVSSDLGEYQYNNKTEVLTITKFASTVNNLTRNEVLKEWQLAIPTDAKIEVHGLNNSGKASILSPEDAISKIDDEMGIAN